MKRNAIIVSLLMAFGSVSLFGQIDTDPISVKRGFLINRYYQGGERMNINEVIGTVKSNQASYLAMKDARLDYNVAAAVAAVVTFTPYIILRNRESDQIRGWEGGAAILVSIPFLVSGNRRSKSAIKAYNTGLSINSFMDKPALGFSVTENGVGLALRF